MYKVHDLSGTGRAAVGQSGIIVYPDDTTSDYCLVGVADDVLQFGIGKDGSYHAYGAIAPTSGFWSRQSDLAPDRAKCVHCGQWGEPRTQCWHCGAPIDPEGYSER